ncbi:MAG: hypothetical protein Q9228_001849 [Teloschistes exilis]
MSRTYIGPFGRILPVLDNSDDDSSGNESQEPSSLPERQPDMATYQLPPPQFPTRLDFGSDPRPGFSEPKNYDITTQAQRLIGQRRQSFGEPRRPYHVQHGQLPPVSQLLTPGSQSSDTSSPYSSHQSPTSPGSRPDQSSPLQTSYANTSPTAGGISYQSPFPASQHPVGSPESVHLRSQGFPPPAAAAAAAATAAVPPYAMPMQPPHDSSMHSYVRAGPPQVPSYPSYPRQPLQIAALSAPSYHSHNPLGLYDYAPNAGSRPEPSTGNVTQSVKPLPRVLGEQDIPGEGPCWVYEDGSICRKVIDGEQVNAQWGVTKAGKPRKRLAIACTTCREKKIKCDPGEGKCQQCDKSGRECRFTTA